jgi:O-antigen/teichoic acid export membrane protein
MSLKTKVVSAAKWSAFAEIASKGITPIIFIVLAWILTPKDFGLVAIATMVISFSQIFWDAGLSKALIQRQGDVEKTANIVFWTNMILGIVIYGLLFLSASFIAHLFKEPLAEAVIKVQGLQIILASLCSVQTALFQKELNFKKLFYVRLLTSVLPGFASIPFALWGYGYWALVMGSLVGAFGQVILLWWINPWRPQFEYDFGLMKALFPFGLWVSGSALLGWCFLWVDSLIVGIYLDVQQLGLYRTGNTLVMMVFGIVLSPILPILFSMFSRMQDNIERLKNALLKSTKIIIIVAFPISMGLFIGSELVSSIIFSDKWQGVDQVIEMMALVHGLAWLVGANGEAYKGIGKPDIETKIMSLSIFFHLTLYLIIIKYGLAAFLFGRLMSVFFGLLIHLFFLKKYLYIGYKKIFNISKFVLFSVVIMYLSANFVKQMLFENEFIVFVMSLILGFSSYLILIFILEKKFIKEIFYVTVLRRK